jgi:uncharacterized protein (DUF433 family)
MDERARSSAVISGREIVHDLRLGMTHREIREKYGLSGQQLKKAFEIILRERRNVVEKIAEDVRSGMKDSEMMEKYRWSNSALQKVYQMLLTEGCLGSGEINGPEQSSSQGESARHERRKVSRRHPSLQIVVSDRSNEDLSGTVKDITDKGLAVKGIEAEIGELKTLVILGDDIGIIDPFELRAECRWVGSEGSGGEPVAGFRVSAISDQDLQSLQQLVDFLDLGWWATL